MSEHLDPNRRGAMHRASLINGIFLLDKAIGVSSNKALQQIKRLFQAKKAGHTGTLDPLARGMLPICLGEATKFSQFWLDADKRYQTVLQLGQISTTGDAEGELSEKRAIPLLDANIIETHLASFRGTLSQIPPMYSALKHQGRPLYEWVRKGTTIERPPRIITIHRLVLLDFTEDTITLDISCSKGTYIRTLGEDIGQQLGCGAYLTSLNRISVSPFESTPMFTLAELVDLPEDKLLDLVLPVPAALGHVPQKNVSWADAQALLQGKKVLCEQAEKGIYRLHTDNNQFIGIGEINDDGVLSAKRMLSAALVEETKG